MGRNNEHAICKLYHNSWCIFSFLIFCLRREMNGLHRLLILRIAGSPSSSNPWGAKISRVQYCWTSSISLENRVYPVLVCGRAQQKSHIAILVWQTEESKRFPVLMIIPKSFKPIWMRCDFAEAEMSTNSAWVPLLSILIGSTPQNKPTFYHAV